MKRCYYQILDVDKKATAAQVKTAYRKMAMKYHPDKNPSQQGKQMFLDVQQAYEVISDPNERTFYDNNRQKILFNKDEMSKEDLEEYSFGFNIWEYFSVKCYKGFGDEAGAFFEVYRSVFEKIKGEQLKAYKSRDDLQEEMRKFEGFGTSTTNIEKVLEFYEDWQNFTTYKTFIWSQEYDTRDAQNRWVKRRMQQENKKERQKQKKNYLKTIRDLVSFVKKRDVRFQQHLIHLRQEQERKEKEKIKKLQEKKKEKQQMKKTKQKLEEERFREIQEYHRQNNAAELKTQHVYQDEDEAEFYCPICDKTFKSENQLMNHEKSKIHKQNVKLIQKEVMLPGQRVQEALKDDDQGTQNTTTQPVKKKRNRKRKNKNNANEANNQDDDKDEQQAQSPVKQAPKQPQPKAKNTNNNNKTTKKQQSSDSQEQVVIKPQTKNNKNQKNQPQPKNQKKQQQKVPSKKKNKSDSQSSDEQDILMSLAQNRNKKAHDHSDDQSNKKNKKGGNQQKAPQPKPAEKKYGKIQVQESDEQQEEGEKKLGKAKLKKMKKAEQQKDTGLKCKTCQSVFPSKTKLFDHIKQSGHAAYKA